MPPTLRQLRVFLCHASQDKFIVRELQQRFADEGWIDPWLDEKKLHPGEEWRMSIEEAVERSDLVVICLSDNSVNKEGFIQKELRYAREIALEKPEGTIFLIPLRLDDCEVPRGLRFFQWTDFFGEKKEQNYNELLESFSIRRLQVIRREEEVARKEAEEREKKEKEEHARREEEARIKLEKEELARKQVEEKVREEAEESARKVELEKAKKEAFENAVREAKEKARLEAEIKVQKEIEEEAHQKELVPNLPTTSQIKNPVPLLISAAIALLIVGLFLGFGLVGMGQLGIGPFAKFTISTISPTPPPTSSATSLPVPTSTFLPTLTPTIRPTQTFIAITAAPVQISPVDGTVFSQFPRTTTLEWSSIIGAIKYVIEVDCFHCCEKDKWCSDIGGETRVASVTDTTYTFDFVGAQPGRWRVWAVNANGEEGPKSKWWGFSYTH